MRTPWGGRSSLHPMERRARMLATRREELRGQMLRDKGVRKRHKEGLSIMRQVVAALKLLNYHVIAVGDSFNDTAMLTEAHVGILFHAPENIKRQFPQFPAIDRYQDLMAAITAAL